LPTATATRPATDTPTQTPTSTATPTASPSQTARPSSTQVRGTPTFTATPRATAGPSPTLSAAQLCADLMSKPPKVIYVLYLHPQPDLVWDTVEHQFLAGLCNTIPRAMGVPQGKYKIVLTFPLSNTANLSSESKPKPAELAPGLNEVSIGPWVPGYENHLTRCAPKSLAYAQVTYNDTPDPIYHTLLYPDGSNHVEVQIQCGGNYP